MIANLVELAVGLSLTFLATMGCLAVASAAMVVAVAVGWGWDGER